MKNLTKKYRVIYRDHIIILDPYMEYDNTDQTTLGVGTQSVEFDNMEDVTSFINENNLMYELE